MFSKTYEPAIEALIFITKKLNDGALAGIKEIVHGTDAPEQFITKILQGKLAFLIHN